MGNFGTLVAGSSDQVSELWSWFSVLLRLCLTDWRSKESMCTTSPSMPQSCSHCLLMLRWAQADLLCAWQASRRHVVITTITFQMPWTPSSPSQRDQGGDEPIGGEVCPELAQAPQTVPVARPVHERATLGPGYGPQLARAAHLSWHAVAAMCPRYTSTAFVSKYPQYTRYFDYSRHRCVQHAGTGARMAKIRAPGLENGRACVSGLTR